MGPKILKTNAQNAPADVAPVTASATDDMHEGHIESSTPLIGCGCCW
jgi:hypothetical protein